ncbi:hypothetical protein JR316_0002879 [Psilocybe cubensis]|uniref:Uncharacterized protein n=2 Tax=Psilocybe cubensis TaxID=181762 RepID=A0ACB8H662_PSICU|nr:hypothetical protein JR316_0002879 [Psilocybe cubensis]KAH9483413.1 hypothetical protein JR316_0002879 [Psilocybe cubensis]
MDNSQLPLPKAHWRSYQTPTKPAAKLLEEIVADGGSHSSRSSSDSFVFLNPPIPRKRTPPFPPLPFHPPVFNFDGITRESTPPLPPLPEGVQPASPVVGDDDVTLDRKRLESQTSKESKRSAASEHLVATGTSPTNSHTGRHHHHQSRTHGRARSASESISSLLVVTTERLTRETARANEAERNAAELLALFKTTHEAKVRLERDLDRVRQELGLYKIQLDMAQKEIFRAQEIVDKIERQRENAEEDAARARSKMHKLMEARAIEQAMEEGRRMGFEEGLRQGRFVKPMREDRESRRTKAHGDRVSRYTYPEEEPQSSGSSGSAKQERSAPRPSTPPKPPTVHKTDQAPRKPIIQPRPGTSNDPPPIHPHGTPPDTGTFSNLLPRPTITTPMPLNIPPTQPQPAPPMPDHQHISVKPEERRSGRVSAQSQPSADVNGPIHPKPVWNHSPSVFHERIKLPPDNYIPTMDANSVITLPPPHELSYPVAPEGASTRDNPATRPRSGSRPEVSQRTADRDTIRTRDYAYPSKAPSGDDATAASANDQARRYAFQSRATSALSRGSTHLSDLDLLTTPRDVHYRSQRYMVADNASEVYPRRDTPAVDQSPTQRIAEEWRSANRQYLDPQPPIVIPPPRYQTPGPRNVDPPKRPFSVTNNTRPRAPRRPREIVMPAPLADVVMNIPHAPPTQEPFLGDELSPPHNPMRSTSSNTVPGIEVVTPSTHASSRLSEGTVLDPVLLTPQSANRPLPLPGQTDQSGQGQGYRREHNQGVLSLNVPSNSQPAESSPLSPISGMPNLKQYPPGFAPSLPKDHDATSPDYKYPSSPLLRPT